LNRCQLERSVRKEQWHSLWTLKFE
jgi:hypothetical protein